MLVVKSSNSQTERQLNEASRNLNDVVFQLEKRAPGKKNTICFYLRDIFLPWIFYSHTFSSQSLNIFFSFLSLHTLIFLASLFIADV